MKKNTWQKIFTALALGAVIFTGAAATAQELDPVKIEVYQGKNNPPRYIYHDRVSDNPDFFRYENHRFGFSIFVPAAMNHVRLPVNGDGAEYTDLNGAGMIISGSHNTSKRKLEPTYEYDVYRHQDSYHDRGDDWYVISYENSQGDIYYQKTFINDQYVNTLRIIYKPERKEDMDQLIPVIEGSFIPGWKNRSKILG